MPNVKKVAQVEELKEKLKDAKLAVLTSFTKVTVEDLTNLRRELRVVDAKLAIVKNSLAKIAVKETELEPLSDSFKGTIAMTIGYSDEMSEPTKKVVDFIKTRQGKVDIVCGVVDGSLMGKEELYHLATLPPKPVVQAMLLRTLQAPAQSFMSLMLNVPRSLMNLLTNYGSSGGK
ncbi:MAG: 50S ribosomal protein L10 [Nitrospinota bacterium]